MASLLRVRLRVLALTVAVLLPAAAPAAAQSDRGAYRIRNFDTHLTVEGNSDVVVEERLDVVFSAPRHGIFRMVPVRYSDPKGFAYSLDLRLIEVGDGVSINRGTVLQTHLFHDRIMRLDHVRLEDFSTLSPNSIVLPGSVVQSYATVGPGSLVMAQESVPANSRWAGNPISRWDRPWTPDAGPSEPTSSTIPASSWPAVRRRSRAHVRCVRRLRRAHHRARGRARPAPSGSAPSADPRPPPCRGP